MPHYNGGNTTFIWRPFMDELFSIKEAANKLRISPLTLRDWIYQGKLTPVKLGRRVLLTQEELERFVEEGKRQGKKISFSSKP
jgi:excisionase family DNA binding protein